MVIFVFLIILATLILSHELGHFSVAKLFGIRVDEFGFGFPPKLFSFKKGETSYSINLLPLGGFVKIFGEDPTNEIVEKKHEDFERSLYHKPKYIQAAVIVAGVFFNMILAWFALSGGFMAGLPVPVGFTSLGPTPESSKLLITEVFPGSPADVASLRSGYNIVYMKAGDDSVNKLGPEEISNFISSHGDEEIIVGYKVPKKTGLLSDMGLSPLDYNEDIKTTAVVPTLGVVEGRPGIGIAMDQVGILRLSFFKAVYAGLIGTGALLFATVSGLLHFIFGLFDGASVTASVSGPIGLIGIIASATEFGLPYLLALVAFISVNLAVLNLVPFPALDGGRLLFLLVESVIRRPLNPKIVNALNVSGFVFLLLLMLLVTYGDIIKLIS